MKVAGSGGCVTTETTVCFAAPSQRRATRRVATLAGSDRSHRFQGRDPEETLPQAGVEMVRLVTAGGDAKPGTVAVVVKKGYLMHDRAVRAARRSRGRQGRVIMREFLCCGLMSIVGRPASVTRTLSFCRNERRGAKRPVGRPAFSSAPLDARSRRQARHHGTGRDTGSDGLMLLRVSSRLVVATVVVVGGGIRLGAGINVGGRPS